MPPSTIPSTFSAISSPGRRFGSSDQKRRRNGAARPTRHDDRVRPRILTMSMIYARISDAEVLRDYRSVLEPGAMIAGAGAEAIRAGVLSAEAVDWLRSNFLKTELELGHCLRLPSEGPCECDLYLSCARFVATPAYAPRLRERHRLELSLADDARNRAWPREVERHCGIARRIEQLLSDLGEEVE